MDFLNTCAVATASSSNLDELMNPSQKDTPSPNTTENSDTFGDMIDNEENLFEVLDKEPEKKKRKKQQKKSDEDTEAMEKELFGVATHFFKNKVQDEKDDNDEISFFCKSIEFSLKRLDSDTLQRTKINIMSLILKNEMESKKKILVEVVDDVQM